MRISDWSSDVCSSDLRARMMHVQRMHAAEHEMMVPRVVHRIYGAVDPGDGAVEHRGTERRGTMRHADELVRILRCEGAAQGLLIIAQDIDAEKIGRASCRERVCQYV